MQDIHQMVWDGGLNIQIEVDQSLVFGSDEYKPCYINVRLPRESYFPLYLRSLLYRIKSDLKKDIDEVVPYIWFEQNDANLPWNIPIGTLYDIMNPYVAGIPLDETSLGSSIQVWKIKMRYGDNPPPNHIPLLNGLDQIQKYWMHQWKQACFVLNGSSKQVMSLKTDDSKAFWRSVLTRDGHMFSLTSHKIIPTTPRNIPIMVHHQTDADYLSQPLVVPHNESWETTSIQTVIDSSGFVTSNKGALVVVSQGIDIPTNMLIEELYKDFVSFDGFLHIVIH